MWLFSRFNLICAIFHFLCCLRYWYRWQPIARNGNEVRFLNWEFFHLIIFLSLLIPIEILFLGHVGFPSHWAWVARAIIGGFHFGQDSTSSCVRSSLPRWWTKTKEIHCKPPIWGNSIWNQLIAYTYRWLSSYVIAVVTLNDWYMKPN